MSKFRDTPSHSDLPIHANFISLRLQDSFCCCWLPCPSVDNHIDNAKGASRNRMLEYPIPEPRSVLIGRRQYQGILIPVKLTEKMGQFDMKLIIFLWGSIHILQTENTLSNHDSVFWLNQTLVSPKELSIQAGRPIIEPLGVVCYTRIREEVRCSKAWTSWIEAPTPRWKNHGNGGECHDVVTTNHAYPWTFHCHPPIITCR
jgi:hypothetical protein